MHGEKFASKGSHNLVTAIEHHVASKMDPGGPGDRPDVVVNRVALDHPPGGQGAADPPRVMEDQGRLEARQPGSDELWATGKTGEEMGLDEAGSYAYVCVDPLPVELDGHPVTHRPQVDEAGHVASVVVHHAHFGEKFRAEHSLQLGRRVATVGAGGDQDNDVIQVHCPGDLLQDRREHRATRLRPRAVAHGDSDSCPGRNDVTKGWPFHRGPQCVSNGTQLVGHTGAVLRCDERGAGGKLDSELRTPISEVD